MDTLKTHMKDWLPPVMLRAIRARGFGVLQFEGDFASWEEAAARCTGYDAEIILRKVLDATLKVKRGEAAFERDSVAFDTLEYAWPVTAGLMWAAAKSSGRLDVLDFGGALGSSYFQNRRLLDTLAEVRWNVIEQPHFVQAGRRHVEEDRIKFHETIDAAVHAGRPNVILLSSVMQYLPRPLETLKQLSASGAECLIIDRTPFSALEMDTLVIQRVPPKIYAASYPMWVLSEAAFLRAAQSHWELVAQFRSPEGRVRAGAREVVFQGMLFGRRQ